jgi:hypothetical protein
MANYLSSWCAMKSQRYDLWGYEKGTDSLILLANHVRQKQCIQIASTKDTPSLLVSSCATVSIWLMPVRSPQSIQPPLPTSEHAA